MIATSQQLPPLPWPPQRRPASCSGHCKVHFIAYYFPVISVCRFCFPFSIYSDTFFPALVPLSHLLVSFLPHLLSFPFLFFLFFLADALRFKYFPASLNCPWLHYTKYCMCVCVCGFNALRWWQRIFLIWKIRVCAACIFPYYEHFLKLRGEAY